MRANLLALTTVLLVSLAVGALLGRRWSGDLADWVLIAIGLLNIGLLVMAVLRFIVTRARVTEIAPRAEAGEEGALPLPAAAPAAKLQAIPIGRHLVLARREGKWILHLQDLGRIEFIELAITLPRGWMDWLRIPSTRALDLRAFPSSLDQAEVLPLVLFALALGVYAVTRLFALDQFPIYFFSDEAINPVLGTELIQNGFRYQDTLFPTYFQNGLYWNLSFSVYLHALTAALFGKSIFVTRATSAVVSLFGAAAVGLILKVILKIKWWWLVVLFLAITPTWFFHSRTAFETVLMVSLYSWFLLCYLLYRYRSPNYLFPALILGAATFYSYSNGQAVMAASGVLLLLSDLRYHLRHWRTALWGVGLLALLVLPYVRFRLDRPEALVSHLRILDSYWLHAIPFPEKVGRFLATYAYGLSPQYWFIPNDHDLIRHLMKGYGHIAAWTFPLFLVGLVLCLRRVQSSAHRAILIAALAAPFGSAMADIAITRVMLFVVPASIFTALGLDALIGWFQSKSVQWSIALASFGILSFFGFGMLQDALTNGPVWYNNYGLFGMAWGTKQLFEEALPDYMQNNPTGTIYLTSTWANGADVFLRFFPVDAQRVQMYNVDHFTTYKRDLDPQAVLVMTGEEYDRARASNKFKSIAIERTLQYPDGNIGFYFAHLEYVDNIDAIFAAEREAWRKPVTEQIQLGGEVVTVNHSVFEEGQLKDLFDNDCFTLVRGKEANPLLVEVIFPTPRQLTGLAADFGTMDFSVTVYLYPSETDQPLTYSQIYRGLPADPHIEMGFTPVRVQKVRIEIKDLNAGEMSNIHIRELTLR